MNSEDIVKKMKERRKKYYTNFQKIPSKYISNLFTRTLISVIIVLLSAIYINTNAKNLTTFKENFFEKSFSFHKISKTYDKLFGQVLPLELEKGTTKAVFNDTLSYNNIDKYENGFKLSLDNNVVTNLYDGIVVFIGNKDNYGNTIIVQGTDGVDIWYGNVDNVGVTLYDYINKDTMLGEAKDNTLYLVFNKEDNFLGYEEYLK